MRVPTFILIGLVALANAGADEGAKFFDVQVLPILQSRCFECHSNEKSIKGGLSLDNRSGWEIGGDHGPAITPRNLKKSPLIHSIRHVDPDSAMPPKKKLSPIEIAMLETWVLMGAPDPRPEQRGK